MKEIDEKHLRRLHSRKKLGVFVVALIVLAVMGFAYYYTEGTKNSIENTVVLAVCAPVSREEQKALEDMLARYAPRDDREPVSLRVFTFPEGYSEKNGKQLLKLIDTMNAGEPNLYLFDESVYKLLDGRVQFFDLSARYPDNASVTEKSLYAAKNMASFAAAELAGLRNCYFAVQDAASHAVTKDARTLEHYKYQLGLLDNLVYDAPGNEPPDEEY